MTRYSDLSKEGKARFDYFKTVVNTLTEGKDKDGASKALQKNFEAVQKQYMGHSIPTKLDAYLQGCLKEGPSTTSDFIIFPFGLNESQKTAVHTAVTYEASVIEGPPGTGKTQTILNIIANAIVRGQSIAVVSNNNVAVENVKEKLEKESLGFIAALLGKRENVDSFVEGQTGNYPDMNSWKISKEERTLIRNTIIKLNQEVSSYLSLKNRKAQLIQEESAYRLEQSYYLDYFDTVEWSHKEQTVQGIHSKKIMEILNLLEDLSRDNKPLHWFVKLKLWFRYNWKIVSLISTPQKGLQEFLLREFYHLKMEEIEKEMVEIEDKLKGFSFERKMDELQKSSMKYLKSYLADRFTGKRAIFNNLWYSGEHFIREYPVVLSTTYSIKRTFKEMTYDYIIVDEASQVDIVTGVLALSCAKNIVIVGDLQQLPNVMPKDIVKLVNSLWQENLGEGYCNHRENLLSSVKKVWPHIATTLLQEHYRCHPKIIGFCNRKFYDDRLIIMTEEKAEDKPLTLYKTKVGNHGREHHNQREIDIITKEILPQFKEEEYADIGIITPYKDQVEWICSAVGTRCEVATVHKYQGREKKYIILSSVDNQIGNFVNDPSMLNVAVSRAIEKLFVVTSGNKENENTLYGDLAKYIEYNNLEIIESTVTSIFDLLYEEHRKARWEYLQKQKRVSEYDSENLLYGIIMEILSKNEFSGLGCAVHVPLAHSIKSYEKFSSEEAEYIKRSWSHNDFVIYDKMNKRPLLAIEVDGTQYHKEGSLQFEKRDALKNSIFGKIEIELLRLRTDGSGEKEKIINMLRKILCLE